MTNDEKNTQEAEKNTHEAAELLTDLDASELDAVAGGRGRVCPFLYIEW